MARDGREPPTGRDSHLIKPVLSHFSNVKVAQLTAVL
jgi:hypothetical protein